MVLTVLKVLWLGSPIQGPRFCGPDVIVKFLLMTRDE